MAVDTNSQKTGNEDDLILSDDEFDSLLATIPLPGFPSPHLGSSGNQPNKRKTADTINQTDQAYEPIQFGEISKYMSNKRKKLKLQESALRDTEPENSTRPQIFSGLVIHVNGHTTPPLSEIRSLIILHGGTYMAYLDHKSVITHIIASSLTPKKREEFRAYKVVKPEWIVRCVSAGRLLNWSEFRLMSGITFTEPKIAEGEATGGQAIAQRNLFDLAQAKHTSPNINPQKESPHYHPSLLSRHSSSPKCTSTPTASSIQSTLKPIPAQSPIKNTIKPPNIHKLTSISAIAPSRAPHSPPRPTDQPSPDSPETQVQLDSGVFENEVEVPNLGRMSCSDPNFIKTYFQQSRLHHLSTWKAELLQRVSILSENKQSSRKNSFVSDKKLKGDASDRRVIMHVDFDCFFISAGLISRPELRGKPLAVCHAKASDSAKPNGSTSEIASCSYEARAFGVRNGQTLGKAKELCPEIQTIPYDFKLYEELSFKFYNILLSYADELQAVSVDECLIDVSGRFANQFNNGGFNSLKSSALNLAEEIRTSVRNATRCGVSIGISYNVLLAKLATKKAKPCGSFFLDTDRAQLILKDLSIDDLPGFGWAQKNEVDQKLSVNNVGELQSVPLSRLVDVLGPSRGKTLHQYAHGIDERTLKSSNHERKSVSAVVNYGIRFKTTDQGGDDDVRVFLQQLGQEVSRRLNEVGVSGRQLTLKIMRRAPNAPVETRKYMGHGICDEFSKTTKLSGLGGVGINDGTTIGSEAWKLLQSMTIPPEDLRGIGIQINRLEKLSKNFHHADKPQVQSTLMFKTTKAIEPPARCQAPRCKSKELPTTCANFVECTPTAPASKKILKTPGELSSTPFAVPPASQLDLGVVDALPTPLKLHIMKSVSTHQKPPDKSKEPNPPDRQETIDLITPKGKQKENPNQFDLPSVSQIDWKMLAELPSSVRRPIEAIYAQRKSSRHLPPPTPPNFTRGHKIVRPKVNRRIAGSTHKKDRLAGLQLAFQDQRASRPKSKISHRVAAIGPSQKLINKKTFKLITRKQPPKTPIHDDPGQAGTEEEPSEILPTPNKISDEQLAALEIDVRFFRELQGNSTRAFQLDLIWNQFQLHSSRFKQVTRQTDRWIKWRKGFDRPAKVLQISLPEPPCIAGRGKKRLSKLEDVSELIEQWMLASSSSLPAGNMSLEGNTTVGLVEIDERDLAIIEKFLLDLVDPPRNPKHAPSIQQSLGQDFEKLTKIVLWWQDLILKLFSPHAHLPTLLYWKNLLDSLKRKINTIACRDFGAPIYDV